MLTTEQIQTITRFDNILNAIHKDVNRYRIYILPNFLTCSIGIRICDLSYNKNIFQHVIEADRSNYIEIINILRNTFMIYGAMVSKLNSFQEKKITRYYEQEIYLDNLEMYIKIDNLKEELEAAKSHKQIITQNFNEIPKPKIKTIQ